MRSGLGEMPAIQLPAIALDSRPVPKRERTEILLEAFDRLRLGQTLALPSESDPRALRNVFRRHRSGRFSWDERHIGSGRWLVRIGRVDTAVDTATLLSYCRPLANARAATIRDLAPTAAERSYRRGESIFEAGTVWPYFALVRAGTVVLKLLSDDGKSYAFDERLPLDALGAGMFDGGDAMTRAQAMTDCALVLLPGEAVLQAIRSDPGLAMGFLTFAWEGGRHAIDSIAELAFDSVPERVAKFLLSYAPPQSGMASGIRAVEKLSQSQIAAAAGTTPDWAGRALERLRQAGALELVRGRVRALDRERLEAFYSDGGSGRAEGVAERSLCG